MPVERFWVKLAMDGVTSTVWTLTGIDLKPILVRFSRADSVVTITPLIPKTFSWDNTTSSDGVTLNGKFSRGKIPQPTDVGSKYNFKYINSRLMGELSIKSPLTTEFFPAIKEY